MTVLIVGGGLSGLAAATYLARNGASVTVLEKAASMGGRASSSSERGFALNRGAHALYTGGPASSVLKELGIRYTAGVPRSVKLRDGIGNFHSFPASPADMLRTTFLSAAEKRDLLRVFLRIGLMKPSTLGGQSVTRWIASVSQNPKLKAVLESVARVNLYSAALDIASADTVVARLQQTMLHPIHYIDGGWQTLVNGLQNAARASGVRIERSVTVARVESRSGGVSGVRLRDGTLVPAEAVLVALPFPDAQGIVDLQDDHVVPVYTACLDLALSHLPNPERPVVFDLDEPRFVTVQSQVARVAPAGGAVLHALFQTDPRTTADPHYTRERLENFLDEVQPGWQDHVVERHFYPHLLASSALPLASQSGMRGRPSPESGSIRNLYFAGDWVGPQGYLLDATLASARESAQRILQLKMETVAA